MADLSKITVTIGHPYGNIQVTLQEWIATGPGPRLLVRPIAARDSATGKELPLNVIPIEYRNDDESLDLILKGEIVDPWHRDLNELALLKSRATMRGNREDAASAQAL